MTLGYLVDTDWAINHLNGQQRTRRRLDELAASGLGFSIILLAEVHEGIYCSSAPERKKQALAEFLQGFGGYPLAQLRTSRTSPICPPTPITIPPVEYPPPSRNGGLGLRGAGHAGGRARLSRGHWRG